MNPVDGVAWVCEHQTLATTLLTWAMGIIPLASALTWWTSFYDRLPGWAQSLLQVLAANLLHAVADPPPPKQ